MIAEKTKNLDERENHPLAYKVTRGAFWVAASYIFTNFHNFLKTVILVRLLSPLDFGLIGIARVVINMLNLFSETGIGAALVQKKEVNNRVLNTAWFITVVRGVLLFAILYLSSSFISDFYNNPQLNPMLKFISLSFLFAGFASVGLFLFVKELNFKNKVIFEQTSALTDTIVAIILAFILKNVWAMVIGYVVGVLAGFIVSYCLHPFRPSLEFDSKTVRGLLHFGKYVFGSTIVVFLFIQGPNMMIGKILDLDSLGFYVLAFGIANTPATSVTHLVSQIAFPAYSKLQDNLPKLREGYLRVARLVVFLSAPIAGGIFMLLPEFVQIFLGVRWMPIVLPARILCIFGFLRSVYSTAGPVFYGLGRPDLEFKFAVFNLLLLAGIFYPLTVKKGILGASIAFSLIGSLAIFLMMGACYKLLKMQTERVQFFKVLLFPAVVSILMSVIIYSVKSLFPEHVIIRFSVSILAGGFFYILAALFADKYLGYGLIDTIRFAVASYRSKGQSAVA